MGYGIELLQQSKTTNNGIFIKKDEFKCKQQQDITPGAPIKSERKRTKQRRHKTPNYISSDINRSKSITVKTKRKLKQKVPSRSLSKLYPLSSESTKPQTIVKRKKFKRKKSKVSVIASSVKKKVSKKCASFKKKKSKKCKLGRMKKSDESKSNARTKSATPIIN